MALAGISSKPITMMDRAISSSTALATTSPLRFGLALDFTGKGKGKLFFNYAQFIEVLFPWTSTSALRVAMFRLTRTLTWAL